MRLRVDRHHAKTGLFALLIVFGGVLGAGAAAAWTQWPPNPPDLLAGVDVPALLKSREDSATRTRTEPMKFVIIDQDASGFVRRPMVTQTDPTTNGSPFRPQINRPWLVFPLGGALIAGALALSLSLRDVRLTGRNK